MFPYHDQGVGRCRRTQAPDFRHRYDRVDRELTYPKKSLMSPYSLQNNSIDKLVGQSHTVAAMLGEGSLCPASQ
jgi:hypothetical protein